MEFLFIAKHRKMANKHKTSDINKIHHFRKKGGSLSGAASGFDVHSISINGSLITY